MLLRKCVVVFFIILIPLCVHADINEDLIEAAKNGQIDRVQALLDTGADVNAKDDLGKTALMVAAKQGHNDIVMLLLERGAIIQAILNDSNVRIRNKPTIENSKTIGNLDKGDKVIILGKSRNEDTIQNMVAPWFKIKTEDGTVGYSYGYFFIIDSWELKATPTFYENYTYGFSLNFPITWEGWDFREELINFGFGVNAPVIYFGLPDQKAIFAVGIYTQGQWDKLSEVEPPDGVEGPPIAQNNAFLFDYSLGHYAANEEMHKRRGEVSYIMKTIKVTDTSPR